jgi:hypothetical protein
MMQEKSHTKLQDKSGGFSFAWICASLLVHAIVTYAIAPNFLYIARKESPVQGNGLVMAKVYAVDQGTPLQHSAEPMHAQPMHLGTNIKPAQKLDIPRVAATIQPNKNENPVNPIAMVFHSARELSRQPEILGSGPEYIELASEAAMSGHILLRLSIDRLGIVSNVSVLKASVPKHVQEEVVVQFYRASYKPGEIGGNPVNSEMHVFVQVQTL